MSIASAAATARGAAIAAALAAPLLMASPEAPLTGVPAAAAEVATGGAWGSYLAGRHAQRVRDFPSAIEFLNHSMEADPTNLDVVRQLFLLTVAEGQMEAALALAPRVHAAAATEPMPPMLMTLERFNAGDYEATLELIDGIEAYGLNEIVMPFVRAWSLAALGRNEEAIAALDPAAAPDGLAAHYAVNRGLLNEFLGQDEAALAEYTAAMPEAGTPPYALVAALGALYERTGKVEEARALYQRFGEAEQSHRMIEPTLVRLEGGGEAPSRATPAAAVSDLLFSVASPLSLEGNEIYSYVFCRLALYLDPENDLALALVAQNLQSQGRHDDAIAIYQTVPVTSAMGFTARLAMADAMVRLGRIDEAIAHLEDLAETYPDDHAPLASVANYLRDEERFEEAVVAYDRAFERIKAIGHEHWTLLYYRGIALERSGMWERAESDFLAALELEPDQPFILNYLGYSWVEQGRNLEQAQQMIETAVELRPRDGFIVDSLGWVLYRLGEYEEAVPHLERAVELQPADPVINDHLGDALWRVGRRDEARYQWRRASELDPDEELAAQLAGKMENGLEEDATSD